MAHALFGRQISPEAAFSAALITTTEDILNGQIDRGTLLSSVSNLYHISDVKRGLPLRSESGIVTLLFLVYHST
jgi:hypothetical protein